MLINFIEDVLDDLSLKRSAGTSEVVEGNVEPLVDLTVDGMVAVAELSGSDSFLKGPGLAGCAVFVCSADVKCLISPASAEACKDICAEDLSEISKVRNIVYIW